MVPAIWLQCILKVKGNSQAEWYKPVIAVFGILRQDDLEFQTSLSYTEDQLKTREGEKGREERLNSQPPPSQGCHFPIPPKK